jgi:type I restriction enzyme S subunit
MELSEAPVMEQVKRGFKRTEVGVIPNDWEVKKLGELFEITSSKRVFQSDWKAFGVPFYRARELAVLGEAGRVDNELFIDAELYVRHKAQYGVPSVDDVLVTGVGTVGKLYVVPDDSPFYFKDGNIIWFKVAGKVNAGFLKQLYKTPLVVKQIGDGSTGTTVGTYTITAAKNTIIPFPSLEEQRAIARVLTDVDGLLGSLDALIAKKKAIKQGAMQQLLTGKQRLKGFEGEWVVKRLGSVAPMQRGFDLPTAQIKEGPYPVVYSNGVVNMHSSFMVKGPGVVTGRSGTLGNVTYVEANYWPHNTALWITSFKGNSPRYIYFLLTTLRLDEHGTGSGVPTLNRNDVHAISVSMPPTLTEQTAIAEVLSDMDAEIEALEARRAKTALLKQGMMQELLTGRTRLIDSNLKHVQP